MKFIKILSILIIILSINISCEDSQSNSTNDKIKVLHEGPKIITNNDYTKYEIDRDISIIDITIDGCDWLITDNRRRYTSKFMVHKPTCKNPIHKNHINK